MKKLLTICLIMAIVFTGNAQDKKPTKEETVSFMSRTIEATNGSQIPFGTIKNATFNGSNYKIKIIYKNSNFTTTSIKWESMIPEIIISEFNECSGVKVSFNYKASRTSGYNDDITNQESVSEITFYVPSDKAESFKKACIRLSEIAKEENKDPFKD